MENNENKSNKWLIIIFILIGFVIGGIGGGLLYDKMNSDKEEPSGNNELLPKPESNISYVGEYEVDVELEGEQGIKQLILREDKTFVYSTNIIAYSPLVGTYEINDSKITLKGIVAYGSDACYFTTGNYIRTIIATIKSENIISIEDDGEISEYKRNVSFVEKDANKKRYVINPVNGQIPSENDDEWTNCDYQLN